MPEKYKHTKAELESFRNDLRRYMKTGNEREFMSFLRRHGIKDEHPRFAALVRLFREMKIGT